MKLPALLLTAVTLAGCSVDPATLFKQQQEATSLTPSSAPHYERVGPLPDTMDGIQAALKASGGGCFATGDEEVTSPGSGTVYLAAREALDIVSVSPGSVNVTANRKAENMTIIVPRNGVEIGRFVYSKPQ